MIKKIKKYFFSKPEVFFAVVVFIFTLTISFLSPINGDDWGNYIIGMRGPRGWIGQAIGMYFDWEGRFMSRILINILTINKWLWNVINASLMTTLYILTIKLVKPKHKTIISLILILTILLIGNDMFTQTYLWIAGNITYFVPMVLIIIYLYMMDHYIKRNTLSRWYIYFFWFVLNLSIPMFVENMGALLVCINLFYLFYFFIKGKHINKLFLISLIISVLSFLAMILSPGTASRVAFEASSFNQLSIFDKVITNIPNFIKYTMTENVILLIAFPISFVYLTFLKTRKISLRITSLIINIIPFLTIILNISNSPLLNGIEIVQNIRKLNFLYQMNIIMIVYWLLYLISFFIMLIAHFKKNPKVIFFFIIGIISNGVMLISPVWGARTSLFTVYMLIVVNLFVLSDMIPKIKNIKIILYACKILLSIVIILYIVLYYNVYLQNNKRERDIKRQLEQDKQVIEIESIPDYLLWGINPQGDYHVKTFKQYYNIPEDKDISIHHIRYKYFILYK